MPWLMRSTNLFLRKAGIFQASNFGAAEGGKVLEMALENGLNRGIGEPDETEHHGVAADGIELVGAGEFQYLRLGIACADQIRDGIGTIEEMLPGVRGRNERDASVIARRGTP